MSWTFSIYFYIGLYKGDDCVMVPSSSSPAAVTCLQ